MALRTKAETARLWEITRKPVSIACPACEKGVLFRVDLSRLEEGLQHQGYRCDRCGYAVKYVPKK